MFQEALRTIDTDKNIYRARMDGSPKAIMETLLAPYKCRLIFVTGEWGIAGRDSLNVLSHVYCYGDSDKSNASVRAGNFVQVADDVSIILGGEHDNASIINNTLGSWPDVKIKWKKQGYNHPDSFSSGPVNIGSNVLLSKGCTILSGVTIGDGAVIGADAVVTKDIPPFAIAAGNPAKVIRYRFDDKAMEDLLKIRWWDFTYQEFVSNIAAISKFNDPAIRKDFLTLPDNAYDTTDNYLVFKHPPTNTPQNRGFIMPEFVGAEIGGRFTPAKGLDETFRFFISQLYQPPGSVFYFIKDIFSYSA